MEAQIRTGLQMAMEETVQKLRETWEYYRDHHFRFNVVLSSRKTNELDKNLRQTISNVEEALRYSIGNDPEFHEKNDFEKLKDNTQLYRLRNLNNTLSYVLAGNDVTGKDKKIHLRCRALHQELKNFVKPDEDTQHKIQEFSMYSRQTILGRDGNIRPESSKEAIYSYAMGLKL